MNYKTSNYSNADNLSIFIWCINICMFLGLACFTLSLFLPSFFTSAEDIYGFWILVTGWIGIIFIQFAWFANPLNLLALLLSKDHPKAALSLSLLALLLASETFLLMEIPTGINQEKVFIIEYGLGFYIWYIAQCLFLLSILSYNFYVLNRNK